MHLLLLLLLGSSAQAVPPLLRPFRLPAHLHPAADDLIADFDALSVQGSPLIQDKFVADSGAPSIPIQRRPKHLAFIAATSQWDDLPSRMQHNLQLLAQAVLREVDLYVLGLDPGGRGAFAQLSTISAWPQMDLQRYPSSSDPGLQGRYGPHVDGVQHHNPLRLFTTVLYLNTVQQGGQTYFPSLGDTHFNCTKGEGVTFPSHYIIHGSRPAITNPKYSVTFFWYKYLQHNQDERLIRDNYGRVLKLQKSKPNGQTPIRFKPLCSDALSDVCLPAAVRRVASQLRDGMDLRGLMQWAGGIGAMDDEGPESVTRYVLGVLERAGLNQTADPWVVVQDHISSLNRTCGSDPMTEVRVHALRSLVPHLVPQGRRNGSGEADLDVTLLVTVGQVVVLGLGVFGLLAFLWRRQPTNRSDRQFYTPSGSLKFD